MNESLALPSVMLRPVLPDDLPTFFEQARDDEANRMAAFTSADPSDRDAFDRHWARILGDPAISVRTVLAGGRVAGHIACFEQFGKPSVSYWMGREYWGQGIATAALSAFLAEVTVRPLFARAAKDNGASLRVLQKCGFVIAGEDRGYAQARRAEVEEFILALR